MTGWNQMDIFIPEVFKSFKFLVCQDLLRTLTLESFKSNVLSLF